ncbi:MAG: Hsp20 family protein, partial [Pseudomonadota bacterium]
AGVSADFTDGVLKIRLPKSETARASERRIEIARR